jgi:hypothetical protein
LVGIDIIRRVSANRMWGWVRIGAGLTAAALLVWMSILFAGRSTVTFHASGEYSGFEVGCAPVSAYLFVTPSASSVRDDGPVDRVETYCDRQRTAYAGLIGMLAVPTVALAWVSMRRPQPPTRRSVMRAALVANALAERTADPGADLTR